LGAPSDFFIFFVFFSDFSKTMGGILGVSAKKRKTFQRTNTRRNTKLEET